ncbi:MAG: glyceraldehyde 3-phosphate dehydrogenase NAD-binding domain-containing protein, partial [Desulfopila sp.]
MTIRVAINGYGRIGRCILRALYEYNYRKDIQIVGINELSSLDALVHLTRFDSAHGTFGGNVRRNSDTMHVNDDIIAVFNEPEIE